MNVLNKQIQISLLFATENIKIALFAASQLSCLFFYVDFDWHLLISATPVNYLGIYGTIICYYFSRMSQK